MRKFCGLGSVVVVRSKFHAKGGSVTCHTETKA